SGGRTLSRLLTPSKLVLVAGTVAAPAAVWIDLGAVGTLGPDCPGCSGRWELFPFPPGAAGLACRLRSAGEVSFLSDWITAAAVALEARAGSADRECQPSTPIADATQRSPGRPNLVQQFRA